ncbi:hypothetical protein LTR64_007165 [Lithohypha guttulata]|uniref:uncharacterized protein n=1 Tax=Lithohypha guttulata TaxID=1690604 RepID=UPI002DE14A47|nr:hypothetical protein LTR51_004280 [Lithohypha guttulata]
MSTGLFSLSLELILRITKIPGIATVRNAELHEEGIYNAREHDEQGRSTEDLVPAELKTLINLSCTCTHFRAVLAPVIYRKLWLTNTITSATSIKAIAATRFRIHVREILFVGRAPGSEEDGFEQVGEVIASEVLEILANLRSCFPNLNCLNVGFAFEAWDYDKWANHLSESFINPESDDEVEHLETKESFRALTASVWGAISRNKPGIIKTLKMRHFFPKLVTTYFSEKFQSFLGGIEEFEMSVWGQDDGVCASNTGDGYLDAISKLDKVFANLRFCTEFTLRSSQYGWMGCEGMSHVPLPLKPGTMPKLERLTLHHCFLGPELCDFLQTHSGTLREITMQDCCAVPDRRTNNGIEWCELFRTVRTLQKLEKVEVLPAKLPYSWHMQNSLVENDEDVREDVGKAAKELETKQDRRMFAYGELNDKYRDWSLRSDKIREHFWRGHDQKEWYDLIDTLRQRELVEAQTQNIIAKIVRSGEY